MYSQKILLYHTGFEKIPQPDIQRGRKNADFGQGFYLSDDREFSLRWAGEKRGAETYINRYELITDGLQIKQFAREKAWSDYIFRNRNGQKDDLAGYDVIMGPIANDTLFDTLGIITSGLLTAEQAFMLLDAGPLYRQITVKTPKAAAQLHFLGAEALDSAEIRRMKYVVREEEKAYQITFAERMQLVLGE